MLKSKKERKKHKLLSKNEVLEIDAMILKGIKMQLIANQYDIALSTVKSHKYRLVKSHRWSAESERQLIVYLQQGMLKKDIASVMGFSTMTIYLKIKGLKEKGCDVDANDTEASIVEAEAVV